MSRASGSSPGASRPSVERWRSAGRPATGALDRERVTARDVRRWFGADTGGAEGLDRLRRRLDAPGIPVEVRAKGRQVSEHLSSSGWASTDPDYIRSREYLECLADLPWNRHTVHKVDLAQVRAKLDEGHAGLASVKERLLDHVAVHVLNPDRPTPVLCLKGPEGVGKTSLAHSLAGALGRVCAQVNCRELVDAAALLGATRGVDPVGSSANCGVSAPGIPCSSWTNSTG